MVYASRKDFLKSATLAFFAVTSPTFVISDKAHTQNFKFSNPYYVYKYSVHRVKVSMSQSRGREKLRAFGSLQ